MALENTIISFKLSFFKQLFIYLKEREGEIERVCAPVSRGGGLKEKGESSGDSALSLMLGLNFTTLRSRPELQTKS